MHLLTKLAIAAGLLVQVTSANSQPSPNVRSHPGVWEDVITPPPPEAPYGTGYTSTKQVIERCSAFEWSIRRKKDGTIIRYAQSYASGYCLGWINSTMAFLNFHNDAGKHTLGVCMPEDIESRSVIDFFLSYVKKNPENVKYNPSLLIYWSLLEKYPCTAD